MDVYFSIAPAGCAHGPGFTYGPLAGTLGPLDVPHVSPTCTNALPSPPRPRGARPLVVLAAMLWRLLADATVLAHLAFIAFAVLGGFLVLQRPRWAWLHLPAALWVIWLEFTGASCPLTRLENALRTRAGEAGYPEGFIEHYLLPVIYPLGLTTTVQVILGFVVLAITVAIYVVVVRRWQARLAMERHAARPRRTLSAEDWR